MPEQERQLADMKRTGPLNLINRIRTKIPLLQAVFNAWI
jgi:hypothetical protein